MTEQSEDMLVLEGGDFLWTVLGTYRWHKMLKVLVVRFHQAGSSTRIKLSYNVSQLALILSLERSALPEIQSLCERINAKILEIKEVKKKK